MAKLLWPAGLALCLLFAAVMPVSAAIKLDSAIVTEKKISSSTPALELNLRYPVLRSAVINRELSGFIQATQKDLVGRKAVAQDLHEWQYSLAVDYDLYRSGKVITVDLTVYAFTGGAHGATYHKIYIYNETSGKLLPRASIFNSSKALSIIQKSLRPQLLSQLQIENCSLAKQPPKSEFLCAWLYDGTKADWSNYSDFYFDGADAFWLFGQYQIAPYASGILRAKLPLRQLKPYIAPSVYCLLSRAR